MPEQETPLIEKLGYAAGEAVDTVDAPEWFLEYLRGNGVHTHAKLPTEWLHMFMTRREQTEHFMRHLKFNEIQKGLWISWPKKGSGIHSDLTDQDLRDMLTAYDWVDVKVCSIDDAWSALKFVRRQAVAI
jgi:hypothetical protein